MRYILLLVSLIALICTLRRMFNNTVKQNLWLITPLIWHMSLFLFYLVTSIRSWAEIAKSELLVSVLNNWSSANQLLALILISIFIENMRLSRDQIYETIDDFEEQIKGAL